MSALITLARILGGFAVAYFQVPWAARYGAIQTYGVEAAYGLSLPVTREKFFDSCTASIVSALFLFFIPVIQLKGPSLRVSTTPRSEYSTDHLFRRNVILSSN